MQAADQPLMPPAANLNAVLGNLAGSAASKAIFKRMPGQGAAHSPRAVGARPAGTTAIAAAHASTCTSGVGAVSRFATSASITSPCEIGATCRIGHSSSTTSAIRSRRPNCAATGSAPSRFSSTRATAISARTRPRPRPVLDIPLTPDVNYLTR